ncbi:transposase [Zobellella iuensis]|uniref:Transposase n=1 Tax=Zobellella iuensis TaxID=2803811 RepID=A0ABS1QU84_9GAMM|nr:transposase [Zobellella iuensis]MBL1378410.1 transposase [Zobellella iuensis]
MPIQIVPLPTYASWLNPIEKLWRKLRQELTHPHPWGRFLEQFASDSVELLRYVGLWIPD